MNTSTFFSFVFILSLCFLACQACYYTDTKCACSLKTEKSSEGGCFDPVRPILKEGLIHCKSRACHQRYFCDCNGKNICHHATKLQNVLEHVGNNECTMVRKKVTLAKLESKSEKGIPNSLVNIRQSCLFTDNICSCSSTAEIGFVMKCFYFMRNDPVKGDLCQMKDCMKSMHCDCAGKKICSRRKKALESWKSIGRDASSNLFKCEQVEATSVEVMQV